jgi:HMG (high mobility group) box
MCFTDSKKRDIMSRNGVTEEGDELLKLVAKEWRQLSSTDRADWDEVARDDKVRFVREKAAYKGPWAVPKRRAKKHPLAPKRPMSAFLKYSQKRRSVVKVSCTGPVVGMLQRIGYQANAFTCPISAKRDNPDMSNTDVSRLLGEMWRNACAKERAPYVEEEEKERAIYKDQIKKFKEEQAKLDAASRTSHNSVPKHIVELAPPLAATRPAYESTIVTFDPSGRNETVEEAANKAEQRMTFRHNFGAPFSMYRGHYGKQGEERRRRCTVTDANLSSRLASTA